MRLAQIPFGTTDWSAIKPVEHKGGTGVAYSTDIGAKPFIVD